MSSDRSNLQLLMPALPLALLLRRPPWLETLTPPGGIGKLIICKSTGYIASTSEWSPGSDIDSEEVNTFIICKREPRSIHSTMDTKISPSIARNKNIKMHFCVPSPSVYRIWHERFDSYWRVDKRKWVTIDRLLSTVGSSTEHLPPDHLILD
jgi:hypothetical protein